MGRVGARRQHGHLPVVAVLGQVVVAIPTIGVDGRSGLDGLADERREARRRDVGNVLDADPPEALRFAHLHGDGHNGLLVRLASMSPFFLAAHVALVDLHDSRQAIAARPNHRTAELVEPRPGGLIAVNTEHPLEGQGVGSVLVAGDLPGGDEPQLERLTGSLEDRSGRDVCSAPALGIEGSPRRAPWLPSVAARRADKAVRPAQPLQEAFAGVFVREEPVERGQILRIIHARPETGCIGWGHTTIYSAGGRKWIPPLQA